MIEPHTPESNAREANTLFIDVTGSGLPEVDGLFIPSTAPPAVSESGTVSSIGYWNGKPAWDRADGMCGGKRASPAAPWAGPCLLFHSAR